jgi:hypothetical protein
MSINWDTILTIGVTQVVSTTFMYYTLKFHESIEKNGKRHYSKETSDSNKQPEIK